MSGYGKYNVSTICSASYRPCNGAALYTRLSTPNIPAYFEALLLFDAARSMWSICVTVGCPSVGLSRRSTAAAAADGFAAERWRLQQISIDSCGCLQPALSSKYIG